MDNKGDLQIVLSDIVKILEKLNVPFHITGGLVSSLYGEPRFTQDIDIVINITLKKDSLLIVNQLQDTFYINEDSILSAIENQRMFQALHMETFIKVDFHVGEAIPGELSRSVTLEILPDILAPVVSIEDSILSKLLWIKKGSHKSRQDIEMMLKLNPNIDNEYLDNQSKLLGVINLLNELKTGGLKH